MKSHIVITGTGRCGTTFLVRLLTRVGLDTGFPDSNELVFPNCNAGLEWDIMNPRAPYIVKNPNLCSRIDSILSSGKARVDHVIVPVRDLYQAAESRRDVQRRSASFPVNQKSVPGGIWGCKDPLDQEQFLATNLHQLIVSLAKWNLPHTLLHFPRLAEDSDYLYSKLSPIFTGVLQNNFKNAFSEISKPSLIHSFNDPGVQSK